MNRNDLKVRAKEIFALHSNENTIFFTNDGQAFFMQHFAEGHSQSLINRTITRLERDSVDTADTKDPVDIKNEAIGKAEANVTKLKTAYEKALSISNEKGEAATKALGAAAADGATEKVKKDATKVDDAAKAATTKSNEALTALQAAERELEALKA